MRFVVLLEQPFIPRARSLLGIAHAEERSSIPLARSAAYCSCSVAHIGTLSNPPIKGIRLIPRGIPVLPKGDPFVSNPKTSLAFP